MPSASHVSLVTGALPVLLAVLGLAALLWLVLGRRRHLIRRVAGAVVLVAAVLVVFRFLAESVWDLWGEPLPARIYVIAGLAVLAVVLAGPKAASLRRVWTRLLVLPAVALVLLGGAVLVNQTFEYFPTFGSLWGTAGVETQSLAEFKAQARHDGGLPEQARTVAPHEATWTPPPDLPRHGKVLAVHIPGAISGEVSSTAYVYLPPAYLASPTVNLPVLVLIHGVPGSTIDWLRGGQVNVFLDDYAAAHKGLAPVVVMPDAGGDHAEYPPLCLNSRQGQAGTYLGRDVPDWVKKTFGTGTLSPHQWAVGGFSYGGTCAMTLAVNQPGVYPTFIDSSGEAEPTIRQGHAVLLEKYFGNDPAAFARQNALDILKTRSFPASAGVVTVGATDRFYNRQGVEVFRAMKKAGMDVRLEEAPGGHAWPAWKYGLYSNLDWLMGRFGVGQGAEPAPVTSSAIERSGS